MKRQRIKVIKVGTFENINQTKLKWFTSMRATEYWCMIQLLQRKSKNLLMPSTAKICKQRMNIFKGGKGGSGTLFLNMKMSFSSLKWKRQAHMMLLRQLRLIWKSHFSLFRNGVTFKGGSGSLKKLQTKLQQLCNIYNADEFVLFCEALPYKNLHFKGQPCSGGKHIKKRITGMAVSNTLWWKISILVVSKSTKSRCFKHVPNLPCWYRAPKTQGRTIIMAADNCPAHAEIKRLLILIIIL